jgi:hypothetical protein
MIVRQIILLIRLAPRQAVPREVVLMEEGEQHAKMGQRVLPPEAEPALTTVESTIGFAIELSTMIFLNRV